jgi:K+-transporting ATPase ATPase C chain
MSVRRDLIASAVAIVLCTALLGIAYPLLVTGIGQAAFPDRANGSRIFARGRLVGSRLIGQDFRGDPRYFQERPSTATSYNAASSSFTNLGPNSVAARDAFAKNLRAYLARERPYDLTLRASQVPIDAVTSSASGIDPDISAANAAIQAHRVASVRHLPLALVTRLITTYTDGRSLGFFGEPGVNVLEFNLALDRITR